MAAFSKRHAYQQAITLLQAALTADGDLKGAHKIPFFGFGGLKELLLPIADTTAWSAEDLRYRKEVETVHALLQQGFGQQYAQVVDSLRNSTLSSFYTPAHIINPIVQALQVKADVHRILEPAAGIGNFLSPLKDAFPQVHITTLEKDDLTFRLLRTLHPDVHNLHTGFENFKNQSFDLIISNIPFGNISVFDDAMFRQAVPVKIKATTRIHNYYFVKALDNLHPGGMLAFITSNGLLDSPGNKEVREYLMQQADLISALRLPNNTFESAGTAPVTDLIVLQKQNPKRTLSLEEKQFVTTTSTTIPDVNGLPVQVNLNEYFQQHADHVLGSLQAGGQYRGDAIDVVPTQEVATIQADILRILSADLTIQRHSVSVEEKMVDAIASRQQVLTDIGGESAKPGNIIIHQGRAGLLEMDSTGKTFKPVAGIRDLQHTSAIIDLRNTLTQLIQAETNQDASMVNLRAELNQHYDLFVFRYGALHHPANKKLILLDAEGFKVLALERPQGRDFTKADIFFKQINGLQQQYARPESLRDAVLLSLNAHNTLDLDFVADVMQQELDTIIRQGLDQELFFYSLNPQEPFITKDKFLSGDVVARLEQWEQQRQHLTPTATLTQDDVENHLTRLREVRPVFLKRELIDINMGERWIPLDVYDEFASGLFQCPTKIKYLGSTDLYLVDVTGHSDQNQITFAASTASGRIEGHKIMEYAMADTQPYLRIRIAGTDPPQYTPDVDGMKNVEMKIREVKDAFENFLNTNPDIAKRIEEIYNRTINNTVKRNYDGAHLQLPGLQHFSPRAHQKDAIWMLLQQDGGIADHKVGAGKTLIMVAAAMEMRRLGIARKPLMLCMKANVAEVAKDFLKCYPQARVLAPDPQKDFTPAKRQQLFASIAANEWDAVILTHDMFQAIPQSAQIKKEIIAQELENLTDDLKAVSENRTLSKRILKGLEARKQNLTVRLQATDIAIKRDAHLLDFDKMGFDHIFVDESQEYKNLHFTTRHQHVAGLGDPTGSQRAMNLEFAIRTIQQKKGGDRGVTFLSGTTISNSLVELYLLFKYLRPEKLKQLQINSFDAWAKMYARKSATYEFSVTNELKMKERYREFIKVPELARFYAEITHVVNDHNLKIEKPRVENSVVELEPTQAQQDYTQKLIQFTKTKNPAYVNLSLTEKEMNAFMLIATNLARKMSIDMRLIDSTRYEYDPTGKVGKLCENIAIEYRDSQRYKGTQLIFSDIGTPAGSGFNLYAEIKRVLVMEQGIPAEEIQFIHDHDTKTKKEKLFAAVNAGTVRILIGSTKKLGTGVNVQERIIAMHHLDIPWRPSDLEQRTGRGGRQGNHCAREHRDNTVANYVYAVSRTLDAYQFNILSNKQKFINQIKNSSIDQRKIDEGAFDQEGGMNFGEYVALLSGNSDLLEKVKLEKKLHDLERTYQVFLKRKSEAEFYINLHSRDRHKLETRLQQLEADWQPLVNVDLEKEAIDVNGTLISDRHVVGEMLLEKVTRLQKLSGIQPQALATLHGFQLRYESFLGKVHVLSPSGLVLQYADGNLHTNPPLAGRYLMDSIKRLPKVITNTKDSITTLNKKINTYQQELLVEFRDKHLINDLKHQIETLTTKLEKSFAVKDELEFSQAKESGANQQGVKTKRALA